MDNGVQNKTVFVDPVPLGKGYLVKEKQTFLARTVELPEDVADSIMERTKEFEVLQGWLAAVYQTAARRGATIEVPEVVRTMLCPEVPKDEQPKKPATAAPSRKKSPTPRKKTKSSSTTNQKTE